MATLARKERESQKASTLQRKVAAKVSRKKEIRKNQRVLSAINPAKKIEMQYRDELFKLIDALVRSTDIDSLGNDFTADAGPIELCKNMIAKLKKTFGGLDETINRIAKTITNSSSKAHKIRFKAQMKRELGIDVDVFLNNNTSVDTAVKNLTTQNVALIKSIGQQYLGQIEQIVLQHMTQGSKSSLIDDIRRVQNVTYKRAKFIARDQTAKFNGVLNQERQKAVGIEEYIWVTSDDERVRDSHKDKNRKKFRWDSPPVDTGHPGHDYNCRCTPRPVINL